MSVTIIVGGQYGSEGKGKVAQLLASGLAPGAVVRVGGPNSGHTGYAADGGRRVLRQLPTAALLPDIPCVLGAGSYVDTQLLAEEIRVTEIEQKRLLIDRNATVIRPADRSAEEAGDLGPRIGSTCSGTGAAVARRIERRSVKDLAMFDVSLAPYVGDVRAHLRELLDSGRRVIIEGTQGFGLSLLHSPQFPNTTSRDTTAAGFLAETGLSPLDVDQVVLVLRAFPIRVAGNSGGFATEEITWDVVSAEGGHAERLSEYTSVTKKLRRVARFDPELVVKAIECNQPTTIVLNHLDHVDARVREGQLTDRCISFVEWVSEAIGREIDFVGLGPNVLLPYGRSRALAA